MADYAKDVLVDTQWVENHLSDASIRIVEVDENPSLYREAHIPGAIGFDWKKDLQDQLRRDFLSPADFGELFGSRGISNDHTIVLYGDRNNWFAAYTYWYLKYYGHDDADGRVAEMVLDPLRIDEHVLGVVRHGPSSCPEIRSDSRYPKSVVT